MKRERDGGRGRGARLYGCVLFAKRSCEYTVTRERSKDSSLSVNVCVVLAFSFALRSTDAVR